MVDEICKLDWNDVEVSFCVGSIVSTDFDAICVSTGKSYSLDGAVARTVKNEGGRRFLSKYNTAKRNANTNGHSIIVVNVSDVRSLPTKYVFLTPLHVADRHCLDTVYCAIFKEAMSLQIKTIVIPALGTGKFGLSFSAAAHFMCLAFQSTLSFKPIEKICFIDINRASMDTFCKVLGEFSKKVLTNGASQNDSQQPCTSSLVVNTNSNMANMVNTNSSNELEQNGTHNISNCDESKSEKEYEDEEENSDEDIDDYLSNEIFSSSQLSPSATKKSKLEELPFFLNEHYHRPPNNEIDILREEAIKSTKQAGTAADDGASDMVLPCSICLNEILPSTSNEDNGEPPKLVIRLNVCMHLFHQECIEMAFNIKKQCPLCMYWYTPVVGNQPLGSTMHTRSIGGHLSCHPDAVGFYEIAYNIPGGVQTDEHIRPYQRYNGTTRVAYLPNNAEGTATLCLLEMAFERRLTFTVGDSVTTGSQNVVVWNGIHHKTSMSGGAEHYGYPDPHYLNRVQEELASMGIRKNLITETPPKPRFHIHK